MKQESFGILEFFGVLEAIHAQECFLSNIFRFLTIGEPRRQVLDQRDLLLLDQVQKKLRFRFVVDVLTPEIETACLKKLPAWSLSQVFDDLLGIVLSLSGVCRSCPVPSPIRCGMR